MESKPSCSFQYVAVKPKACRRLYFGDACGKRSYITNEKGWHSFVWNPASLQTICRVKVNEELLYKEGIHTLNIPCVLKTKLLDKYAKDKFDSLNFKLDDRIGEAVANINWEEPYQFVDDDCKLFLRRGRRVELNLPEGPKFIIDEHYYEIIRYKKYHKYVCYECAHTQFPEKEYCMIFKVSDATIGYIEDVCDTLANWQKYCNFCTNRTLFAISDLYERDPIFRPSAVYPVDLERLLVSCGPKYLL